MKIKYLSDGRKVSVIGKLNSQEMIVQEIFVTKSGDEIPSGESFTTKSIHDEKVLSWKEKDLGKTERRINEIKTDKKNAEKEYRKSYEKLKGISEVLKQSRKLADLFPEKELNILTSFMTGTIEYLVIDEYEISPPVKMIDKIIYYEDHWHESSFDSIKLCSFLGKSGGDTEFRINTYSDGSGSGMKVYPFTNLIDAVSSIKERAEKLIEKDRLSIKSHKTCEDLGIIFDDELEQKYITKTNKQTEENISSQVESIEKSKKHIEDLKLKLLK